MFPSRLFFFSFIFTSNAVVNGIKKMFSFSTKLLYIVSFFFSVHVFFLKHNMPRQNEKFCSTQNPPMELSAKDLHTKKPNNYKKKKTLQLQTSKHPKNSV